MKVLLFDTTYAYLTPGGKTVHALKLQQEISKLGVDIQFARWWDMSQKDSDIIHFLSPNERVAKLAKCMGMKTFCSTILDFESSKTERGKRIKMFKNRIIDRFPAFSSSGAYWKAFPYMDRIHFMHKYDKDTALRYFPKYIDPQKVVIIPHAYEPSDMNISEVMDMNVNKPILPPLYVKYLVSCANISHRKQNVKLAMLAKKTETPIVFIGSNFHDSYFEEFEKEIDNRFVFYPGYVSKECKDYILKNASGFVLLSLGESGCISVYEAAAYKLPLLLSDLPWAWGYDSPTNISYCNQSDISKAAMQLREFYEKSGKLDHTPFRVFRWSDVASLYVHEYTELMNM